MRFSILCLASALLGVGCAAAPPPYDPVEKLERVEDVTPDKALVVLIYAAKFALEPTLYLDGEYIGTLGFASHASVLVEPGEHRFMVIGQNIDLMDATVAAGEVYHVLVRGYLSVPAPIVYKGHFALDPYNEPTPILREYYSKSTEVRGNQAGADRAAKYLDKKNKAIRKYTKRWEANADRAHLHTPTAH
jgi:hypothetical protein